MRHQEQIDLFLTDAAHESGCVIVPTDSDPHSPEFRVDHLGVGTVFHEPPFETGKRLLAHSAADDPIGPHQSEGVEEILAVGLQIRRSNVKFVLPRYARQPQFRQSPLRLGGVPQALIVDIPGSEEFGAQHQFGAALCRHCHENLRAAQVSVNVEIATLNLHTGDS